MKMKELKLETNGRNCLDLNLHLPSGAMLQLTAPRENDYWWNQVAVGSGITVRTVPQFGGCDFQIALGGKPVVTLPGEMHPAALVRGLEEQVESVSARRRVKEAVGLLWEAVKAQRGYAAMTKQKR